MEKDLERKLREIDKLKEELVERIKSEILLKDKIQLLE
jgi:hypothetical protein